MITKKCKWCDKQGFLLKLSINGLCDECNPIIVNNILENAEKYKKNINPLSYYISPKEGLERINILKSSLNLLRQYELKGIPTIKPLPSELLQKKIYGACNETIDEAERRLINENDKLKDGILNLDCELYSRDIIELKGDFIYDEHLGGFVQICTTEPNPNTASWCFYDKQVIEFSEDFNSGYYREYYASGKLRREIPFLKESNRKILKADGTEKLYYEGEDSEARKTYTILEENFYKNGESCGVWKRYSIDGGLMEERVMEESHGSERKEFYPETKKLRLEEHKDWGKEYYDNGNLKAEWENKDYLKVGKYISYYRSGKIDTTATYIDGVNRDGLVNKYFESGALKELWSYNKGKRKSVKKYFENGNLKTEWLYNENGGAISKNYYDESGNLIKKK